VFREECSAADSDPRQSAGDRIEPTLSSLWLPCSGIVVSSFIGPGWLPEQFGSLHKAGSTKMTQATIATAGIDISKAKLDIAIHGRAECWQVANTLAWLAAAGR
jgi:transposase